MRTLLSEVPPDVEARQRRITTSDGAQLHIVAFVRPAATATILYFGGNMFTIAGMGLEATRHILPLGFNLVLVDYRGYGLSSGQPSTIEAFEADALTVYDSVRADHDLRQTMLVVHGHSLGSFAAGYVAQHRDLPAVILESSVTTGEEWLAHADARPWYVRLVTRLRINERLRASGNLARIGAIEAPTLFLVGSADPVTPPALSRRLFDHANSARYRELHVIPGAGHNDIARHPSFRQIYWGFVSRIRTGEQ